MSHAGQVVLFGGAVEPDETAAEAALRELAEESNTHHLRASTAYRIRAGIGTWTTESGILVEGFLGQVPERFVHDAIPDSREVARIGYAPVRALYAAPVSSEFHLVEPSDRMEESDGEMCFESPTSHVNGVNGAERWVLWGLAGFMVSQLRARFATADQLLDTFGDFGAEGSSGRSTAVTR
jgi:hypothetical protein